jgi:hypothetical protein
VLVRTGVMAHAYATASRPLLAVEREAFANFDVHVELRRLLWGAVAVLALVLLAAHALATSD